MTEQQTARPPLSAVKTHSDHMTDGHPISAMSAGAMVAAVKDHMEYLLTRIKHERGDSP